MAIGGRTLEGANVIVCGGARDDGQNMSVADLLEEVSLVDGDLAQPVVLGLGEAPAEDIPVFADKSNFGANVSMVQECEDGGQDLGDGQRR